MWCNDLVGATEPIGEHIIAELKLQLALKLGWI